MNPAPISDELKQALLQWDDTDDTRAASKARLDALGPNVFSELTALTYSMERRYLLGERIMGAGLALSSLGAMVSIAFAPKDSTTLPFWNGCCLAFSALLLFGGIVAGGVLTSSKLATKLLHALATFPPSQSLPLLLHLPYNGSVNNTDASRHLTTVRYHLLAKILDQITEVDSITLTPLEMRRLRGLVSWRQYCDISVAALRVLTLMADASLLPEVRKLAKRTRNWELQEAVRDYLRRFAPDEVMIHHRMSVTSSKNNEAAPVGFAPILASVMRLGSRNSAEQEAAKKALRNMQPEELRQVSSLLDQESPDDKRASYAILTASFVVGGLPGSLIYFWALRWPYFDASMALKFAVGCAMGCGAFGFMKGSNINYNRRNRRRARMLGSPAGIFPEKRLLETLSHLESIALIGTILEEMPPAATLTKEGLRYALRQSLQQLLPRLRADNSILLTEQHRTQLNQELQRSRLKLSENWAGKQVAERQADFDVAIIKAWEQVGDERALPFVQQLATMTAKSQAKKRVREAAEQCLPYLEARVGEQRQTQTLLRASDVPTEAGDILLRAATAHAAPVKSEQLLRAGIRNNEE